MRGGLTGTLRLGAIPTALTAASLLTTPFCERHPRARVSSGVAARRGTSPTAWPSSNSTSPLTYLDDDSLRQVRRTPLYEERYLLLTPTDGPLAGQREARWAEVAALPLCLLVAADAQPPHHGRVLRRGRCRSVTPAIETDTVAGLYAHLSAGRWSSVISHAWLHMFGVPEGMRVRAAVRPRRTARASAWSSPTAAPNRCWPGPCWRPPTGGGCARRRSTPTARTRRTPAAPVGATDRPRLDSRRAIRA